MAAITGVPYGTTSATRFDTQPTGAQTTVASQVNPTGAVDWASQVGPAYQLDLSTQPDGGNSEVRQMKRTGKIECQTCKERTYQDGSDDPGVSFKAPGHISPEASAAAVMSHEQEHVTNEQANARASGSKVVAQSVRIFSAVCPECGKVYVSGGETKTTTQSDASQQEPEGDLGNNLDLLI